jgi:hypothetical protein
MKIDGVMKRLFLMGALLGVCLVSMPCSVFGANVSVYAEGAYTDSDLKLYIYADITDGPILSFGVKVTYPSTLTYAGATKNESVWYFGNESSKQTYMDPEDDGSNVVIIGGKLDDSNPTAGVEGNRVLLGTVTFTHESGVTDFSGVSVTYGRGTGAESDSYKNFVDVDGEIVDGSVTFNTEIHERGDANANGEISTADYIMIRNNIGSTDVSPWMDCNDSGDITTADYICVRNKM